LVNLVGMTNDAGDTGAMADGKLLERNGLTVCWFFHGSIGGALGASVHGGARRILVPTWIVRRFARHGKA
jgi:hypothetical protein